MSTSTPNISLTTFGDITSDQNHLWPSFALSDDENDWDRLQGQRKAIDAKIAELERRQMIMEGTEATPKAKDNFEPSTKNGNALFDNSLSLKVEELNRKYTELEEGLNDAKQKEEDKLAKVEAENKDLMVKFAEMIKEFDTLKKEMNDMKHNEGDKLSKFETEKNELLLKVANLEQIVLEMKGGQKNGTNFENYNSETNIPEINEQNEKKNGNKRDKANAKIIGRTKAKENEKQKSEEKAAELPEKDRVVLLHGTTRDGRIGIAWYFVLLHSHKPPPVLDGAPRLEIDEHGQILFCGWGREPPNDVIKATNTKYGLKFALRKAK